MNCSLSFSTIVFFIFIISTSRTQTPIGRPATISEPTNPGAKCVTIDYFNPSDNTVQNCARYLTYEQIYIDIYVNDRLKIIAGYINLFPFVSSECRNKAFHVYCYWAFRECFSFDTADVVVINGTLQNRTITVGGYPCLNLCEDLQRACFDDLLPALGNYESVATILNCTTPAKNLYGSPSVNIFPNGTGTYFIPYPTNAATDGYSYSLPCYDENRDVFFNELNLTCPSDLHQEPDSTICTFGCPEPLFTDKQLDILKYLISILSWCSFASCLIVLILFLMDIRKIVVTVEILIFHFTIAVLGESFSFTFGSMFGYQEMWCSGDAPNEWGNGPCTTQGVFFTYFILAIGLWWLIVLFNTGASLHWANKNESMWNKAYKIKGIKYLNSLHIAYMIIGWGLPLIPVIIGLSAKKIGFSGSELWCTVHSGSDVTFEISPDDLELHQSGETVSNIWNLLLITFPLFLMLILGIAITIYIFTRVLIVIIKTASNKTKYVFILKDYWRLYVFILSFMLIILFLVITYALYSAVRNAVYQSYGDYIYCSLQYASLVARTDPSDVHAIPKCELLYNFQAGLWFVEVILLCSLGIITFVIFGTHPKRWETVVKWIRRFAGKLRGRFVDSNDPTDSEVVDLDSAVMDNSIVETPDFDRRDIELEEKGKQEPSPVVTFVEPQNEEIVASDATTEEMEEIDPITSSSSDESSWTNTSDSDDDSSSS